MATRTKPPFGTIVRAGHPLARGLVGAWAMNEGGGPLVTDLVRDTALQFAGAQWGAGADGHALTFDDTADASAYADVAVLTSYPLSVVASFRRDDTANDGTIWWMGDKDVDSQYWAIHVSSGQCCTSTRSGGSPQRAYSTHSVADTRWHQVAGVFVGALDQRCYVDGGGLGSQTLYSVTPAGADRTAIGRHMDSTPALPLSGQIGFVFIWSRALSGEEIAWLWREPYCFLGSGAGEMAPAAWGTPGQVLWASGTAASTSTANARAAVSHACDRPTDLSWPQVVVCPDQPWRREMLFHGRSAEGFRYGTILTRGRFWALRRGAGAVYRGAGADPAAAAFGSPVMVDRAGAKQFVLPAYLEHGPGSIWCYVLRRFNASGEQERTTGASTVVRLDAAGQLAPGVPNAVYMPRAMRTADGRVRVTWFYCPLQQAAGPRAFRVYWDAGTGQLDLEHALGEVRYAGRRFYRYETEPLGAGACRFAVRAVAASGAEGLLYAGQVAGQAGTPSAPDIVSVEAV
jgi:hypothetical protein